MHIRSQVNRPLPGREEVVRLAFRQGRTAEWLSSQTPWWQFRKRWRRRRAFNRALKRWVDNSRWEIWDGGWVTPRFPHWEW